MSAELEHDPQSILQGLTYAVATHVGQRRGENQDSVGISIHKDAALFLVADGMGGAFGGAYASSLTVRILDEQFGDDEVAIDEYERIIRAALGEANREIFTIGRHDATLEGMGTTASGFLLTTKGILLFNVGDSRVYRLRGNAITQLTTDHTLIGELLESGALTPEQAERSPVSHMLTRSVGPTPEIEVDCFVCDEAPSRDDIYLICSDGLYNTISSAEIGYVLGEYRLDDALEHLIGLANMRGGTDNISGILVECGTSFPVFSEGSDEGAARLTSSKKNIVHIDIAEADAADTFSKVKKEVDISAEILWGAHKSKATESRISSQESTIPSAKQKKRGGASILQRALVLCGIVFCITVVTALWISNARQAQMSEQQGVASVKSQKRILDLTEHSQDNTSQIRVDRDSPEHEARRKKLVSRLQIDTLRGNDGEVLASRKRKLEDLVAHFQMQLKTLGAPIDPALLELQKSVEHRQREIRTRLSDVEKEIAQLTESLNRWQIKLEDIEEVDTVNVAAELAGLSPEVKKAKEEFEVATWEYLKALEPQRFNPDDKTLQAAVDTLVQNRNEKLKSLSEQSRSFIESIIIKDSRERGLLVIEKDELQQDEKMLLADLDYIQVRSQADPGRRQSFEVDLKRRIESAQQEFSELAQVVKTPVGQPPLSTP